MVPMSGSCPCPFPPSKSLDPPSQLPPLKKIIVYECLSINLFIAVTPSSLPPPSHKIWMINDCYGVLYVGPLPSIPSPLLTAAASSFLKEHSLFHWLFWWGYSSLQYPSTYSRSGYLKKAGPVKILLRFYTQVGWEKF